MADNLKVGLGVEVNGVEQSINSIKDLKNAIKAAKDEQVSAALKFGETSKEYVDAGKKLAALKDKVEDLNDSTKSLKGSGLERAKEGLSQFGEGLRNLDFDKVKIGLSGLKTALASTGILLITAAVGYLIENFDELSKSTGVLGTVLRTVGDVIKTVTNFVTDLIGITSSASRELEDLAEQNVANAEAAKEALASQTAEYDRQINAAKLAGKSTVDLEIAKQQAIINTNKALVEQTIAYVRQGGILDDEKKKALNEQLEAIKGAVAQQNTIELTAQKDREEKNKAAFEKRKERIEKEKNDELNALRQLEDAKINNETNEEKRAFAKAVLDRQRRDEDINALKVSQDLKNALLIESEQTLANQLKAINDKADADKKAIEDKAAADKLAQDEKNKAFLDEYYKKENDLATANIEKNKKANEEFEKAKLQIALDGLRATQELTDLFFTFKSKGLKKGSAEEEALAKKQFQVNKALQLATATVSGFQAVQGAFATATASPITTVFPAYPFIQAGLAGVFAAANIAKIAASQFQSSGGNLSGAGGGGVGSPNIPEPPTINNANNNINGTQFDEQGNRINGGQQNPQITVTAQVVESHMTAMQHSVSTIKQQAIF